jgi:hypothetical protein
MIATAHNSIAIHAIPAKAAAVISILKEDWYWYVRETAMACTRMLSKIRRIGSTKCIDRSKTKLDEVE